MNGKLLVATIVLVSLISGAAIYYMQIYAYYREIPATGARDVLAITLADGTARPVPHEGFRAIDADSSPIRYRACFTTPLTLEQARAQYVRAPDVLPRNAPGWFDCYDAAAIGAELEAGTAEVFLGQKNIAFGVDRVVAITGEGRGFVWHTLNDCEAKDYDGTVIGEECPARPERDR